MVNRT
jgi:hypothetical protein